MFSACEAPCVQLTTTSFRAEHQDEGICKPKTSQGRAFLSYAYLVASMR